MNRFAQTAEAMRKSGPGRKPGPDFMLLHDCCQAQLLDPNLAGDAVQFMSLQVKHYRVEIPSCRLSSSTDHKLLVAATL